MWEIRKKVIGGKKSKILPTSIMHPSTKKSVVNRNEIREVTLKYCIDTLTNNIPDEAFKKEIEEKKEKVKEIMKEEGGEFKTNWETIYSNI